MSFSFFSDMGEFKKKGLPGAGIALGSPSD
jgi:hypothetical protein